jgi:hypothetical protein
MRSFTDPDGGKWTASVAHEESGDYKGQFYLTMRPEGEGDPVALRDIRWNSERSARRTLETMSVVELRRRLRSAAGRAPAGG